VKYLVDNGAARQIRVPRMVRMGVGAETVNVPDRVERLVLAGTRQQAKRQGSDY
jgi:hypothetical protein